MQIPVTFSMGKWQSSSSFYFHWFWQNKRTGSLFSKDMIAYYRTSRNKQEWWLHVVALTAWAHEPLTTASETPDVAFLLNLTFSSELVPVFFFLRMPLAVCSPEGPICLKQQHRVSCHKDLWGTLAQWDEIWLKLLQSMILTSGKMV